MRIAGKAAPEPGRDPGPYIFGATGVAATGYVPQNVWCTTSSGSGGSM